MTAEDTAPTTDYRAFRISYPDGTSVTSAITVQGHSGPQGSHLERVIGDTIHQALGGRQAAPAAQKVRLIPSLFTAATTDATPDLAGHTT